MLYYKLYRRRKSLYLGGSIFAILVIFMYYSNNSTDSEFNQAESGHEEKGGQNRHLPRMASERININTYKIPETCKGCPGEMGNPVFLTAEESKGIGEVYAKEFFNLRASDKISLWRSLPDFRNSACKQINYAHDLPTASVIFIFKNERWSSILRSVYSVINRSPRHLLEEVILVDDLSDIEEVKKPLDDYCEEHFGDIVRILRPTKRLGLIAAKNYGGRRARGDVLVFLDAHIEATEGW